MKKNKNEFFIHYRNSEKHVVMTVAIITDKDGNIGRGVAIRSFLDNPDKRIGREIALVRAKAALYSEGRCDPLPVCDETLDYINIEVTGDLQSQEFDWLTNKSEYNPSLPKDQRRVVYGPEN